MVDRSAQDQNKTKSSFGEQPDTPSLARGKNLRFVVKLDGTAGARALQRRGL